MAQGSLRLRNSVLTGLIVCACLVWPIYVFPVGYPQPVSVVLVLAFVWMATRDPQAVIGLLRQPELALLALFVGYSLIINLAVGAINQTVEPLQHSLFYAQVLIGCMVTIYFLCSEPRAPRVLYFTVVASLALQAVALLLAGASDNPRATALFANPNQLGLYSLLSLGVITLLHRRLETPTWSFLIGVALAIGLCLLSLSKAAIIAVAWLLLADRLAARPHSLPFRRLKPVSVLLLPVVAAFAITMFRDEIAILGDVLDRLASIGLSSDDSLQGRGYARIVARPEFLVFGAGEGMPQRFGESHELHSMFGTLLFSYGLPGAGIVLALLAVAFRRNARDFLTVVVPILVYGLTHHPMRQWMTWSLILMVIWLGSAPQHLATTSPGPASGGTSDDHAAGNYVPGESHASDRTG